jgi:DNA-binding PadR family transcriptional regulator
MRSLVNWALLGLVIERPSYAYELAQRFERTYEEALSLSSVSHVYTALGTLRGRNLVEELPGRGAGRQPRPHYRATEKGVDEYRCWLVGQIGDGRQRQRLFVLALSALARRPEIALGVLDRYEEACLEEARVHPHAGAADAGGEREAEIGVRLACEDAHLAAAAKLAWIEYARCELQKLANRTTRPG